MKGKVGGGGIGQGWKEGWAPPQGSTSNTLSSAP